MHERVIPEIWLPKGRNVERIVLHWSAGAYKASGLDKSHYHFMIQGDGSAVRGVKGPGEYLAHTRNLNTGSVGLSICAMAGAVQGKADGDFPLKQIQWERAAQAAAEILEAYGLDLNQHTCLTHSEVTQVYGKLQRGKWDIDRLPFAPHLTPAQVHANFRDLVKAHRDGTVVGAKPVDSLVVTLDGVQVAVGHIAPYEDHDAAWTTLRAFDGPLQFEIGLVEEDKALITTLNGPATLPVKKWPGPKGAVGYTPIKALREMFHLTSEWDAENRTVRLRRVK